MITYRVRFKDKWHVKEPKTVVVMRPDFYALASWLNYYTLDNKARCIGAEILDRNHSSIAEVAFLPTELSAQKFIIDADKRLLTYNQLRR